MEIDVSKCEFYYDNYCDCYRDSFGDCYHKCTDEELYNCYYKQLQQLKTENEELKNKLKMQKYKRIVVECGKRSFKNILHKYTLFQQCLDEIEEIIKELINCGYLDLSDCINELNAILQLIKQAKEGGEC